MGKAWQVLVAGAALLAVGCGGRTTEPAGAATYVVASGDTVRLKIGDSARVPGAGLTLVLQGVSDSRCPIDAMCVWAGDAAVTLEARQQGAQAQLLELHTSLEPKAAQVAGYTFRVVDVAPAPVSTSPTRPQDFVVSLEVSR